MPKNLPNPKVCVPHEAASDKHVDGGSVRTPPLLRQSPIDKHIRVRQRIGSAVGCCAHACLVGRISTPSAPLRSLLRPPQSRLW